MNQNAKLDSIRKLHKFDCKLISLRKKHQELPNSLRKLDQAVEEKQKAVQEAEGSLTALRSRNGAKNLELKEHESTVQKYDSQLKSVKTNKEYAAILSEITSEKADIAKIEDEMLILMDSMEQQEQAIAERKKELGYAEKDREDHKYEIAAQQQDVEKRLKEVAEQRRQAAQEIDEGTLHQYERILQKRGATAVVPVVDNSCQGCFMKMAPEVQATLLKNEGITYCRFCSRIIHLA